MSIGAEVSGVWVTVGVFVWGNGTRFSQIDCFSSAYPLWRRSRLCTIAFQLSLPDGREVWEYALRRMDWGSPQTLASSRVVSLKPVLPEIISKLAMYSSAVMPGVILSVQLSTGCPFLIWVAKCPFN